MEKNKIEKQKQNKKEKPLTLTELVNYGHEVLFPYMDETFVKKNEFLEFKDKTLTGIDNINGKLDILLTEKDVKHYQDKKHKKISEIHNETLERNKLLLPQEANQIAKLEFF